MSQSLTQKIVIFALCACINLPAASPAADDSSQPAPELKLKLQQNRVKNFGDSPTLIVPTVFVKFAVEGKVFAVKQGGGLFSSGNANTVKAKARYTVQGLDKKLAQEIAGKVYDDFVARMKEAGFTVKTYADIKDDETVKNAERASNDSTWGMPTEKDASRDNLFVVASPSDEQAFKTGLVGGVFNQFMKRGKSTLGEGTIVMPTYTISAPQAWAEASSGYKTISASANVAPGMNLTYATVPLLTEKGAWGDISTKEQVINISEKVGELSKEDKTDKVGNAFSAGLSALTGAGKISGSSADYQLTIDPTAYTAGALNGTSAFNAQAAKAAGEAKK